jgi:hypothetical protein
MMFFKLTNTHYPGPTTQEFESLVWTERYREPGDFLLTVPDEITTLSQFPIGTLVSHTDTNEVMIVENHEIKRDSNRKLKIKISGRGFETFAENRVTLGSEEPLYDAFGEPITEITPEQPSASSAALLLQQKLEPGTASAEDEIPNLLVVEDINFYDDPMSYAVPRGDLYSRIIEFLKVCDGGIRVIRPHGAQTTLNLVIHDGEDLSEAVVFYAQYADFEEATYFQSNKDYRNYASVAANTYSRLYRTRDLAADVSGLARRVIYQEASDIVGDFPTPSASDVISARGQSILDQHRGIFLMQATISQTAKPKFKIDYEVGDIVTVFGEFNIAQAMRVTEHILTVDSDGQRGFPSLSAL